mgnify:CR=1 FL=1
MNPATVHFCPRCGGAVTAKAAGGRLRPTCSACGETVYCGPAVGVAVIVRDDAGRVLLGKRARGRYAGLWCIPCGYVEWGEDVRAAAAREFAEETGLDVEVGEVAAVLSNFHDRERLSVGIWFWGRVRGGQLAPADGELSELGYFDPASPPRLAFPTDGMVLATLAEELRRTSGQ